MLCYVIFIYVSNVLHLNSSLVIIITITITVDVNMLRIPSHHDLIL